MLVKPNYIKINDTFITYQKISNLPIQLNYGWIKDIFTSDSDVTIKVTSLNEKQTQKLFNASMLFNQMNINGSGNKKYTSSSKMVEQEAMQYTLDKITAENNLMYEISILVVTKAASLKELKQKISMNEKIARSLKMEIKLINNKMFDEYKLSIMGNNISDDDTIFLPSSSLINGYGFT
ncbi:hypothetical protein, partial [Mycoplasma buteonis]|uniref:hypothetical protein n=1 Tax=Mycoplasma buteonis TaxID=171280 RepID=UPI000565F07D